MQGIVHNSTVVNVVRVTETTTATVNAAAMHASTSPTSPSSLPPSSAPVQGYPVPSADPDQPNWVVLAEGLALHAQRCQSVQLSLARGLNLLRDRGLHANELLAALDRDLKSLRRRVDSLQETQNSSGHVQDLMNRLVHVASTLHWALAPEAIERARARVRELDAAAGHVQR